MNQDSISALVSVTVDTFEDQNDGSAIDGLSLRDAIIQANSDTSKKYIINVPSGTYDLTITADGSLDITSNIDIIGESAADTIISASFLGDRILNISSTGFLNLSNITLQDANVPTDEGVAIRDGGAILINPSGRVTLENTIIARNSTNGRGGGIANNGRLELNDSVILINTSVGSGGGVYNSETGTLTVNRSTIAFNSTGNTVDETAELGGGGIFNATGGNSTIVNSTISNNVSLFGGGIWNQGGTTTIIGSTIAGNQGGAGAGIFSGVTQVEAENTANTTIRNSIVAQNTNSLDIEGDFNSASSFNLIGRASNNIIINGRNNNQVGTENSPIDPLITSLPEQFETVDGASTILVHQLLAGSPAINIGDNGATQIRDLRNYYGNTDQTLQTRIVDQVVDIGSVEYNANLPPVGENDGSIYRFQNSQLLGTYLFVNPIERQSVIQNYPQFTEEGFAFKVGITPEDDLIPFYRFQNQAVPGTYLYTNEIERQSVLANYPNFLEEGIAFYVYDGNANQGEDIYRLQNTKQPGTYLFVTEGEKNQILAQYDNFLLEGVAFEVNF